MGQSELLEGRVKDVEGAGDLAPEAGGDRRGRVLTDQALDDVTRTIRTDERAVVNELVVKQELDNVRHILVGHARGDKRRLVWRVSTLGQVDEKIFNQNGDGDIS